MTRSDPRAGTINPATMWRIDSRRGAWPGEKQPSSKAITQSPKEVMVGCTGGRRVGVARRSRALDGRRRQSSRDLLADGVWIAGKGDEARMVPRREACQQARMELADGCCVVPRERTGPEWARRTLPSTVLTASLRRGLGVSLPCHKARNQEFTSHLFCHRYMRIPLVNVNNRVASVLY